MKKGILFSLSLQASFSIFSQDYQCIMADAQYLFWDGMVYHGIAIDSVQTNPGYESYFNFPTIGFL